MTQRELQKAKKDILERISTSDNFAVLVSDPDSDAVGSGLAMEEILDQMGKKVKLYSSYEIPQFSYLPRFKKFIITDIKKLDFGQFETIITVDSSEPRLVLDKNKHPERYSFPKKTFVINIDHHDSNPLYGQINYVDSKLSSASEALYEIFASSIEITPSLATNLFAAIVGDTKCFQYIGSTTAKTLRVAADLLEKGANQKLIIHKIIYSFDEDILKMNIDALKDFKIKKVGKYKYSYAVMDIKKYGFEFVSRDRNNLAKELLRSIKGTDFSVLITPTAPNLTKLSFRGRRKEIVKIANYLGGGGHKEGAAARVELTVNKALEKLDKFLQKTDLPEMLSYE